MKNMRSIIKEFIKVVVIVAIAVPMISLFAAWTGPSGAPPTNNADAPINVGPMEQIKDGILGAKYFRSFYETLLATDGGNVGIGQRDWIANPPTEKLDVTGRIKISDDDLATPAAGTIKWTGTDFMGYTGATWVSLTAGGTSGPCPPPKQPVLIGSQLICLNDGAYAGIASAEGHEIWSKAEARYQGGALQIKVRGRYNDDYCDTGWINQTKAGCLRSKGEITPRGVTAIVRICITGHATVYCYDASGEKLWP